MMDHFVWKQGATQVHCHDQSVLADPLRPAYEPPQTLRHWDDPVAMIEMTVAGYLADGA
jgi:hypothetical protein